jgi:hypothetical protein
MTKSRLLTAALIAAAMLAPPVAAREKHPSVRHLAEGADVGVPPGARYIGGRLCYPAPRVDAFAGQPWDNDIPCEPGPGY